MCHRISFDETFNQTEPVARNVIRSCVFEEEWSKLRHCRRGGGGQRFICEEITWRERVYNGPNREGVLYR